MISWMKSWMKSLFHADAILPSKRLILCLLFGFVIVLLGSLIQLSWLFFGLVNGIIFGIAIVDAWLLRKLPRVTVTRECPEIIEMEEKNHINIQLMTEKPWTGQMWVEDDYPIGFNINERTFHLLWSNEMKKNISYWVKPHRRGKHRFGSLSIRMESPWKLWIAQSRHLEEFEAIVYPRLEAVRQVRKGWVPTQVDEGVPTKKLFGMGNQLSHLREYQQDDDPRQIDWKATAKSGKLISKVMIPERGQHTAIMIDCGRMMGKWQDGASQLDRVLEAAWATAAMALKHGDSVSFIAFSHHILRYIPPRKGMAQLQRIMGDTFDLEPSFTEANYIEAWKRLEKSLPDQSLVLLFSDFNELAFSNSIEAMIRKAIKQHTVMTVSIEEPHLRPIAEQTPENEKQVNELLIAKHLLEERENICKRWQQKSVLMLDVLPNQLASYAIDGYLHLRRNKMVV